MINRLMLIGLLLLNFTCSEVEPDYALVSNVSLSVNQEFTEVLSKGISIEGGYSISKQAQNYSVSEIRYVSKPSVEELQFVYKPKEDFTGTDVVVLKNCISAGGSGCDKTEYVKFVFKVTRQ